MGLYRVHSVDVHGRVAARLADTREVEQRIEGALGEPLTGKSVLDVGAGQVLLQMVYFGRHNQATGIDLEVIAQGADVRAYARMLQANGARRTFKTVGRKLLQVDRHYRRELLRQCDLRRFPRLRVLQMDASAMSFADGEFDVVHSSSVLPHIPEPERAVREMARVLRPGGVAHLNFHLYTSDTGSEDPRVIHGKEGLPLWPHLRPAHAAMVHQHAFLNKLRLAEWQQLLSRVMPGCELSVRGTADEAHLREQAIRLQAEGELIDYTLEELLTRKILVLWRKP